MPTHYLFYWRYQTVETNAIKGSDKRLNHVAGAQLSRVQIGDVVWIVTVPPKSGHLFLVGRLIVGWKGTQYEAAQLLHESPDDLWEAEWHIISHVNTVEFYDLIDISNFVEKLRFVSKLGRDRLDVGKNGINPQALQTMRQIKLESAQLLDEIWYGEINPSDNQSNQAIEVIEIFTEGRRKLQVHYRQERNQKLVQAAKSHFKSQYGRLFCEVCGFDFALQYGSLGENYIEAHHRKPLAELLTEERESTIDDLAMVCANCHRVLHRRKPWLSVEQLKDMLKNNITITARY